MTKESILKIVHTYNDINTTCKQAVIQYMINSKKYKLPATQNGYVDFYIDIQGFHIAIKDGDTYTSFIFSFDEIIPLIK